MRDSVNTYLGAVARRLLLARAAEALAGGAAAGGAVSLPLMAARIVGERHPSSALVPALLPLLAGASVALMTWGRGGTLRWLFVLMATAASAALVVDIATPAPMAVPHWSIPLVLVCLGGFGAVAAVLIGGVSRRDAALYLDHHADLAERLTTAVELDRCGSDAGFARAVWRNADRAVQQCRSLPIRYWRRTRATPALGALVLLACVVMALVRPLQPEREAAMAQVGRQLVAQAAQMQQWAQMSGPAIGGSARELHELGRRMQQGQVTLDAAIRRLERVERDLGLVPDAGQRVHRIANDLHRQKERLAAAGKGQAADDEVAVDRRAGGTDASGATGQGNRPEIGTPEPVEAETSWQAAGTRVFAGGAADRSGSGPDDPAGRPVVGPDAPDGYAPLDRSWLAARRRAARALDDRVIPIRHRRLIRSYFSDER